MKDENRTEPGSWRERLLAMNLILPIPEVWVICEAVLMAGCAWRSVTQPAGAVAQEVMSADAPAFQIIKPTTINGVIMDPGTLKAMSEEMSLNLMMMMTQTVALIIGLAAIACFAIYLIGIAWLCSSETRQPARCRMHSVPKPPEPDEYDLLVTLACLSDSVAGEAMDRDLRVMRHA